MAVNGWICDKCGTNIDQLEDGWFEWYSDKEGVETGFRIVHKDKMCMYNEQHLFVQEKSVKNMELDYFTEPSGLEHLLEILSREEVKDKDELIEMIKRIHVPGYETRRNEED